VRAAELPPQLHAQADGGEEPAFQRIELGLLDAGAVAELLDALALPGLAGADWAPALHRHTHGNPLFILETLRALLEPGRGLPVVGALPLPLLVGQLIEQRLARLSERALHLARVAALAGQDFSLELAAELIECSLLALSEPWRELETAQVLHEGSFAHDLVQDATRRSVPRPIAQALHGRIAAHLAERQVPPARLAAHWGEAAQWAAAGRCWVAAADAAYTASRVAEALACRESAIVAFERSGDAAAAFSQGLYLVAELLQTSTGERALAAAERLFPLAPGDLERAQALVMQAHAHSALMRLDDYLACATRAHELALGLDDPLLRSHTALRLAMALAASGRAAEAVPVLDGVRTWVMVEAPVGMRCSFLCDAANVLVLADTLDGAEASYAQAIELALAEGQLLLARQALHSAALLDWRRGKLAEVERKLHTALGLREGGQPNEGMARREDLQLGALRRVQGRFGEAVGLLERVLAHYRELGPAARTVLAENELAQLWLDLGQPARARQALQTTADGEPAHVLTARRLLAVRVETAVTGHPGADTLAALRALVADASTRTEARLLAQIELARHEPPAQGLQLALDTLDEARRRGGEGVLAAAQIALVRQITASGDITWAAQVALEALAAAAPALALTLYRPEAWWILGCAFAAAGHTAAATQSLTHARAWIEAARGQVPAPFSESFVHRQPLNQALLTASVRAAT
jgi:tetratricopeptide (TPR) repeat protein